MYGQIKKHTHDYKENTKTIEKDFLEKNVKRSPMNDVRIYDNLNENFPDIHNNLLIQRKPIEGRVVKKTKAVKIYNGSIYESDDTIDVEAQQSITVESQGSIWSRRGPVGEGETKEQYRNGEQKYEWFPLIQGDEVIDYYMLENSFKPGYKHLDFKNRDVIGGVRSEEAAEEMRNEIDAGISERKGNAEAIKEYMRKMKNQGKKRYAENMFLGPAFERAVEQYIKDKHEGYPVVSGIRYGKAELDFVVFQRKDVIIYSAKIDKDKYSPKVDRRHWETILNACYDSTTKNRNERVIMEKWDEIKTYLPLTRQELNPPVIRLIYLGDFIKNEREMTPEDFINSVHEENE